MKRLRLFFFNVLEPSYSKKDPNRYFDYFIIVLIILNVFAVIIGSEKTVEEKYSIQLYYFEIFSVVVFSIEYVFRVWTCVENQKFKDLFWGRLKFMSSPMAIIDLLAIMPFYLPFMGIDLRFLRILRLFRIFRIFKMVRYSRAFLLIRNVLREKREELLVTLSFILIILVIISTLMYYIERDVQPESFSSIPKALWWGIITLTTVGYGDVFPITTLGKILGGLITILSVGLIALPSGILASGYTEQIVKSRKKNHEIFQEKRPN